MICSFADIAVKMETRFSFLEHFCADYRLEDTVKPSLCVRVTDAELEAEIEECLRAYPHLERDKISMISCVASIPLLANLIGMASSTLASCVFTDSAGRTSTRRTSFGFWAVTAVITEQP